MHTLAFELKRAHQSSLAMQRLLLAPLGITPARADLLFVLAREGLRWDEHCVILQSKLWRLLGVRAVVVCRMLKALELAGYVTRHRYEGDRRQLAVHLTLQGRSLLTEIEQIAFRFRFALYVSLSLRKNAWELHSLLGRIRASFGDRARFEFPWTAKVPWGPRNRVPRKFQRGVYWWSAATGIVVRQRPPR